MEPADEVRKKIIAVSSSPENSKSTPSVAGILGPMTGGHIERLIAAGIYNEIHNHPVPSETSLSLETFIAAVKAKYLKENTIRFEFRSWAPGMPLEEMYVNLAIVEEKEQKEKEEKLRGKSDPINRYEEIYGTKKSVELEDIFTVKDQESKSASLLKRLLMLGRAGIGKSTLCQFMAYQWAKGKLWQKHPFKVVIWLRLRHLLNTNLYKDESSTSLAYVIWKELGLEQVTTDSALAVLLKQLQGQILYVLDGFDEVASVANLPPEQKTVQSILVHMLLSQECVLITSRPYAIDYYEVTPNF